MESQQEIKRLVETLQQLTPGSLPLPVFIEVARLTVTPILEVVPLRLHDGTIEVLLLERENTDPVWGGQLHTPGTVIRASDTPGDLHDAFERITHGELGGCAFTGTPTYVETVFHQVKRGRELAMIHWIEVTGEVSVGKWYPVGGLPATIVSTQIPFIHSAVKSFKSAKKLK